MYIFILCLLTTFSAICADTTDLKTGNWLFDKARQVELSQSDYVYSLKTIHVRGMVIELFDRSLWEVCEMTPESASFYQKPENALEFEYVNDLMSTWEEGDHLIFHRVSPRDSLLVYNKDKNQLLDVKPFLPPLEPLLMIVNIDKESKLIQLSDDSIWKYNCNCAFAGWKIQDPILIARNTPWIGAEGYVLINLLACECENALQHIHCREKPVTRYISSKE